MRAISSPSNDCEMRIAMPRLRKRTAQDSMAQCQKAKITGGAMVWPSGVSGACTSR